MPSSHNTRKAFRVFFSMMHTVLVNPLSVFFSMAILAKPASLFWFNQLACFPHRRAASVLQSGVTRTTFLFSSRSCRMSSLSATHKNEYLVIIPDHPDSLQKRLAVREKHLENVKPKVQSGDVLLGGAILSRHPKEGEQPDMTGSAMLIKAESEEAVREWIASDVYTKGGAWNVDEAKIYPFRSAVRTAM